MKITQLKTDHIHNPLGFTLEQPVLSWLVTDTPDATQQAAQVLISTDSQLKQIVFDSGCQPGQTIDSLAYQPALTLKPRTRYYWQVQVWGETETATSDIAWFETAKMQEPWQAQWITPDWPDTTQHPILFRDFTLPAEAQHARIYICGLGLYHLELNGTKVGNEYFAPHCNAYDRWLQYQTYDITDQLHTGSNQISVMLGNGWYKGRYGANGGEINFYGEHFALLCELHITLKDGQQITITSDTAWQAQPGPILDSSIFDGETFDARICPTPDPQRATGVRVLDLDMALLEARRSVPVTIQEEIQPIAIINTPAGETVVDMGQNMTGWLRFKTNAPAGTRLHFQFGEVLQNGNFFRDNLRTAKAEYIYIADGNPATVEPFFTFYGFRYVKISGWPGPLELSDFTGCVIYSAMEATGSVSTSDQKVNQLIHNALWGQKGNFLDIPTDCPQRDERLGWTGDIQVFCGTAIFNMDAGAFLAKYAYDLSHEQDRMGGMVPHIVPMANLNNGGSCAWGDVATILPWTLYQFYGDRRLLATQFDSMRAWADYIYNVDENSGSKRLWTEGEHFGDWLALDAPDPVSRKGGTPIDFIASAFYCYSARLVAQAAQVLGYDDLATSYSALSSEVLAAIQHEYFTPTGRLAVPTQTGYVLTLFMDLAPAEHRARVEQDFIARLKADNLHLKTGFVGTPYLCRVLSDIGANDIAYTLLLNEDYPSWLYAVNLGATTIWERWNSINPDGSISSTSMNSLNHYAYGSIVEWMYRDMCGLNPIAPGFCRASITPRPDPRLQWAKAHYRSAAGLYESGWQYNADGSLTLDITVPFNAAARITLPDAANANVLMNGEPCTMATANGKNPELDVKAGTYRFTYHPA